MIDANVLGILSLLLVIAGLTLVVYTTYKNHIKTQKTIELAKQIAMYEYQEYKLNELNSMLSKDLNDLLLPLEEKTYWMQPPPDGEGPDEYLDEKRISDE